MEVFGMVFMDLNSLFGSGSGGGLLWDSINIVTCMSDYRRGLDWWLYLLNIYTHNS
jgi:hypothetical protein